MNAARRMDSAGNGKGSGGAGFFYGLGAYGLWGILPIYFKLMPSVGPFAIVAHRILWSLPFLAMLIVARRGWSRLAGVVCDRKTLLTLAASAALIGVNWTLYTYAVVRGHILAASFGYYLNPIANVLLGRFVLGERLSRLQWTAVAIAAAGISVLAAGALGQLWISLTLCVSFALYGLLRKVVAADPLDGLVVETALLSPLALLYLTMLAGSGARLFAPDRFETSLLLLSGVATTTPLLLFTAAARRLRYSTLGMIQFLAPTLQFLIAVLLYGEHFSIAHAIAFGAIWTALSCYLVALLRRPRLPQPPE